ncbi:hypothetical protein JVU11DRAFT_5481 [Chiua virens]|nr:hypothetical protein JVU11DRAFT_5481 [Chiua virens]
MNKSSYEHLLTDWLETDSIVNSPAELSPVISLSDLPDVIPEHDEYRAMPHSLRYVLVSLSFSSSMSPFLPIPFPQTPPTPETFVRPKSILLESAFSHVPQSPSPYSRSRRSPSSDSHNGGVSRARQSVSSIGSCSTAHTRSAVPVKSILTRHDSGISMVTTTKSTRRKKRRTLPSVKFVDAPTVHYEDDIYCNDPFRSPPSPLDPPEPTRWFTRWWKRSPPPRPPISGPYHLSYGASLADAYTSRSKPKSGRLKRLWQQLTSLVG